MKDIDILLPGLLTPTVINGVTAAFTVHRLWEASDRAAWLREHGAQTRGLATTGSHGPIGAALFERGRQTA